MWKTASHREKMSSASRLTVYVAIAVVMLGMFIADSLPERSAGTCWADNAGTENYPLSGKHSSVKMQHAGLTPTPIYLFEYFNDFIFPVSNETGKRRVLLCDIVLELNDGMTVSGRRQQLRKLLFRTSQSLSHDAADICEMKKQLCDRIKNHVNETVGMDTVREVHITKFLLL